MTNMSPENVERELADIRAQLARQTAKLEEALRAAIEWTERAFDDSPHCWAQCAKDDWIKETLAALAGEEA